MEFNELNVEYGYTYESAAVVPTAARRRNRSTTSASTSPRPGRARPLPHAWIDDEDGTPAADQGPRRARALPADRRRGRRGVVRGRPASSPPTPSCRSTPCASATSTATSTTRAARGCAIARSAPTARSSSAPTASSPGAAWALRGPADELARRARPDPREARRQRGGGGLRMEPELDVARRRLRARRAGGRAACSAAPATASRRSSGSARSIACRAPSTSTTRSCGCCRRSASPTALADEMVPLREYRWFGADGEELMTLTPETPAKSGWEPDYLFFQPELERALDGACARRRRRRASRLGRRGPRR